MADASNIVPATETSTAILLLGMLIPPVPALLRQSVRFRRSRGVERTFANSDVPAGGSTRLDLGQSAIERAGRRV